LPAAVVEWGHGTAAVARTDAAGVTTSDYPSTVVEGGAAVLWMGYRPYGTSEEHSLTYCDIPEV
jgi:hypothetical protein